MREYIFFLFLLPLLPSLPAYAQEIEEGVKEIFISRTGPPLPVIDGKWSVVGEWGMSTERLFVYEDEARIAIRLAHERENIYVLLDMVSDTSVDRGTDKAVICFDTELNGGDKFDIDDYCFMAVLDGSFTTYSGGGGIDALSPIASPPHAEMKAGVSDVFDRYSRIPHLAYELKVPIESLKRTDVLGFYAAVFDSSTKTTYSWPISLSHGDDVEIKGPSEWGKLISPDKSIPEFPTGISFITGLILLSIIFITRGKLKLWGTPLRNA
ncbi:MAG: hypothetical protein ACE5J2_07425 [Nitrososphaerales archaeon]